MGMKEKMMNSMIDGMSSEEKKAMMEQMMDQFLGSLTDEEKQDMMNSMMPRMMEQMMGEGGTNPMAGMMQMMMGGGHHGEQERSSPMDMCRRMMAGFASPAEASSTLTPEISALFSEWKQQLEEELLSAIQEKSLHTVDEIATHMNLSRESVIFFLSALAQQDRIKLEVSPA